MQKTTMFCLLRHKITQLYYIDNFFLVVKGRVGRDLRPATRGLLVRGGTGFNTAIARCFPYILKAASQSCDTAFALSV